MSLRSHFTGRIRYANEATFGQLVLESDVPVLVEFYADWCDPCRALSSTLEQLARENPGVRVVKVNIDEEPLLTMRYGIESVPSVMVLKAGDIRAQHVGIASKSRLQKMLSR